MPRPVSISRSLTSFRRVSRPLSRYWLSPPRNTRRPTVMRPSSAPGRSRSVRRVRRHSAIPSGLRLSEPLKMTSSMVPPRSDLALCSPSTQVMASERLLLPQPLGPTMAVTPPAKWTSTGSTKDLKPEISRRSTFSMGSLRRDRGSLAEREARPQVDGVRQGRDTRRGTPASQRITPALTFPRPRPSSPRPSSPSLPPGPPGEEGGVSRRRKKQQSDAFLALSLPAARGGGWEREGWESEGPPRRGELFCVQLFDLPPVPLHHHRPPQRSGRRQLAGGDGQLAGDQLPDLDLVVGVEGGVEALDLVLEELVNPRVAQQLGDRGLGDAAAPGHLAHGREVGEDQGGVSRPALSRHQGVGDEVAGAQEALESARRDPLALQVGVQVARAAQHVEHARIVEPAAVAGVQPPFAVAGRRAGGPPAPGRS